MFLVTKPLFCLCWFSLPYDNEPNVRPMDAVEDGVGGDGGESEDEESDAGELTEALRLTGTDKDSVEVLIRGRRLTGTFSLLEMLPGTLLSKEVPSGGQEGSSRLSMTFRA